MGGEHRRKPGADLPASAHGGRGRPAPRRHFPPHPGQGLGAARSPKRGPGSPDSLLTAPGRRHLPPALTLGHTSQLPLGATREGSEPPRRRWCAGPAPDSRSPGHRHPSRAEEHTGTQACCSSWPSGSLRMGRWGSRRPTHKRAVGTVASPSPTSAWWPLFSPFSAPQAFTSANPVSSHRCPSPGRHPNPRASVQGTPGEPRALRHFFIRPKTQFLLCQNTNSSLGFKFPSPGLSLLNSKHF